MLGVTIYDRSPDLASGVSWAAGEKRGLTEGLGLGAVDPGRELGSDRLRRSVRGEALAAGLPDDRLQERLHFALDLRLEVLEVLELGDAVGVVFDGLDAVLDRLLDLLRLLEPSPPLLLDLVDIDELLLQLLFADQLVTDFLYILLLEAIGLQLQFLMEKILTTLELLLDRLHLPHLPFDPCFRIEHHSLQILLLLQFCLVVVQLVNLGKLLLVVALDEEMLLPLPTGFLTQSLHLACSSGLVRCPLDNK
jgi:hypothetical protein